MESEILAHAQAANKPPTCVHSQHANMALSATTFQLAVAFFAKMVPELRRLQQFYFSKAEVSKGPFKRGSGEVSVSGGVYACGV